MRITLIPFILPCFFNVLLASPLPEHDSLPLRRRLHDISGLIARADVSPVTLPSQKFKGFTKDQEKDVAEAVHHAITHVLKDCLDYVEKYREDAPRFKEWFGHPDPKRWERLRTLFQDMDKHIRHGVYVYDPHGNDDNAIATAGVDPRKLGKVYIYPHFFTRPLVGYRSKTGIIIHEWSHFDAVGVTSDHDKTRRASRRFAEWDPDGAIENAYSIQYFAENEPHLG